MVEADSLFLTRDEVTTHFRRVREPSRVDTPARSQPDPAPAADPGYPQAFQPFAGGNSPATSVTKLAAAVRQFNSTIQSADLDVPPQPPLTVDELRCFARWKLQNDKQLSVETKGVLENFSNDGTIFGAAIEPGALAHLKPLPNLYCLRLKMLALTHEDIVALCKQTNLSDITITMCGLSNEDVEQIRQSFPDAILKLDYAKHPVR